MTDIVRIVTQPKRIYLAQKGLRGSPGQATVTAQAGNAVGSRSLMSAIASPLAGQTCTLAESGREGLFVFSNANLTSQVTSDTPTQGIYVPPSSDTTGASGAWVRVLNGAPLTPEMFGAVGNGTGDDYPVFKALAAFASGSTGLNIRFGKGKTYFIGQHRTAANSLPDLTFQNAAGLTIDGNGSVLSFDGTFDRAASTTAGIGTEFVACSNLKILNLELSGNVQNTTNSSGSVESAFSYGMQINGCTDVVVENVYSHHFATDGLKVTYNGGVASKRVKFTNVRSHFNARQGLTLDGINGFTAENCEFDNAGQSAGTYGHHAPTNGLDFEPSKDQTFVGGLDIDPGDVRFVRCTFRNNAGAAVAAVLDKSSHDLTLDTCRIEAPSSQLSTSTIIVGIPRTKFKNCYIDVSSHRMEITAGSNGTGTHVVEDCEIRGTAASANSFYSAISCPVYARNNRFICTATAVLTSNFIALTNPKAVFENNYVFIPAATYSDGGATDANTIASVAINNILRSTGNRYETDLAAASGSSGTAHFYLFSYGTTQAFNEKFAGTAAGTADTFRPSAGSAFDTKNLFSNTNLSINGGTPLTLAAVYSPSLTPASVAAATVAEQTFTVSGLTTADKVIVNPPAIANATGIAGARVSAANTLAIRFANPTAGALTPTSGTYTVLALRS